MKQITDTSTGRTFIFQINFNLEYWFFFLYKFESTHMYIRYNYFAVRVFKQAGF